MSRALFASDAQSRDAPLYLDAHRAPAPLPALPLGAFRNSRHPRPEQRILDGCMVGVWLSAYFCPGAITMRATTWRPGSSPPSDCVYGTAKKKPRPRHARSRGSSKPANRVLTASGRGLRRNVADYGGFWESCKNSPRLRSAERCSLASIQSRTRRSAWHSRLCNVRRLIRSF